MAVRLASALDARGILDRQVAAQTGSKRQTVSQWCRPGGAKNIGVAQASLLENDEVRAELAQIVAGESFRVVRAPAPESAPKADLASLMSLADGWAKLLHASLAAHADGVLEPSERRVLLDLVRGHRDATHALELVLAADELPGERR